VSHRGAGTDQTRFGADLIVGYTLLTGVLLSLGLIATGLAWHWAVYGTWQLDYVLPTTSVAGFIATDLEQAAGGRIRPRLFVNSGLAVLLLTPYVRVLLSMVYFMLFERNLKYTIVTAFVLATLTYSLREPSGEPGASRPAPAQAPDRHALCARGWQRHRGGEGAALADVADPIGLGFRGPQLIPVRGRGAPIAVYYLARDTPLAPRGGAVGDIR
jgi:uncharacterized membrane protein